MKIKPNQSETKRERKFSGKAAALNLWFLVLNGRVVPSRPASERHCPPRRKNYASLEPPGADGKLEPARSGNHVMSDSETLRFNYFHFSAAPRWC